MKLTFRFRLMSAVGLLLLFIPLVVGQMSCTAPEEVAQPTAVPATATPEPLPTAAPNTVYVNAAEPLGEINPLVYGTNFGPWVTVPFDLWPAAEAAGIRFLRFPGGNWGDLNNITERQIDQYMDLAEMMNATPQITARLRGGTPEQAAELVHYTNIEQAYNVRYWSIGNEPSLYPDYDTERYNSEWRTFAQAMLAVDPDIVLIGPDTHQFTGNPTTDPQDDNGRLWLQSFLEANGDMVDIVAVHRYPFPRSMAGDVVTIEDLRQNSQEWDQIIPNLRQVIRDTTGEDKPIAFTEVNSNWSKAVAGEATPDSFYNAIWWADVLGRMINQQTDMVAHFVLQTKDGAGGWGLLARTEVRPSYYVYQMYQQLGQTLLPAQTDISGVSVVAAQRADGTLTLILINLTDTAVEAPLQIVGHPLPQTAQRYLFDPTHNAEQVDTIEVGEEAQISLPPTSISLLVIAP